MFENFHKKIVGGGKTAVATVQKGNLRGQAGLRKASEEAAATVMARSDEASGEARQWGWEGEGQRHPLGGVSGCKTGR